MRQAVCSLLFCICLGVVTASGVTAIPVRDQGQRPAQWLTPVAGQLLANDNLLKLIPQCDNMKPMRDPIAIGWTNFAKRVRQLERAEWGYFVCPQAAGTVAEFYRARLNRPPYNLGETNWVTRRYEGTLGIYYNYATRQWLYLWVVPKPGDERSAYVVVAKSTGMAFHCRLRRPSESRQGPRGLS